MPEERFPKQEEQERAGGQHGTRNIGNVDTEESARRARRSPSESPEQNTQKKPDERRTRESG